MRWSICLSVVLAMGSFGVRAQETQIRIENPNHDRVREEEVATLYRIACQQVAKASHIQNYKQLEYPLTLVLGAAQERYVIDRATGSGTIYLLNWDETHFISAAVRIALYHVTWFESVVAQTLQRFRNSHPISISDLRKQQ
jgi:hypothetical protein